MDLRCHLGPAEVQWDFCVWEQVVFIQKLLTDKNQNASLQKEGGRGRKCSRRRGEEGQCEGLQGCGEGGYLGFATFRLFWFLIFGLFLGSQSILRNTTKQDPAFSAVPCDGIII